MDAMNERQEPGEQGERPDIHDPVNEWNSAATERHLGEERPAAVERPTGQPYPPQQPYAQPYPPNEYGYGRNADPSLPLGQAGERERNAWRSGREGERRRGSAWVPIIGGCLVAIAAVMALCAIAGGIVFGLARNIETATGAQTRDFTVNGPATITVRTSAANVRVVPGTTDQVTVVLSKEARGLTLQRAQQLLDAITLDVTQSGNSLTIGVNEPSSYGFDVFSRSVELTITTPAATSLNATLSAGNLDVRGLTGTLAVELAAGNLTLDDMTISDHATVRMHAGNVQASRITGALTATISYGNVTLSQTTLTQNSTIRSDAGNVSFDGSLRSGVSLDVTDNAGNVSVTLPQQTDARLNATSNAGKITIAGWSGISETSSGANASATGDLSDHPTGTVTLHVDAGNITLTAE